MSSKNSRPSRYFHPSASISTKMLSIWISSTFSPCSLGPVFHKTNHSQHRFFRDVWAHGKVNYFAARSLSLGTHSFPIAQRFRIKILRLIDRMRVPFSDFDSASLGFGQDLTFVSNSDGIAQEHRICVRWNIEHR